MKKVILLISFLFWSGITSVYANTISSINMDVYVKNNGDAEITEVWDANVSSGTEGFHPYIDIGNSSIQNYTVSDENGSYTYINNWDINQSREEKANKNGIYQNENEYDLCFGIGSYGSHTYTLKYTITNFIYTTTDNYQILYWTLIPRNFNASPNSVNITIHSDNAYDDKLPVWGFGNYGGLAYVYDGNVEMSTDGKSLGSDQYMTILVKFPAETFNTTNSINKTFDNIYSEAEEGATAYKDDSDSFFSKFLDLLFTFLPLIFIIITIFVTKNNNSMIKVKNKIKLNKDVPMFRDIPTEDLKEAYLVSNCFNLMKNNNDVFGAVLLKMIQDKNIEIKDKMINLIKAPEDELEVIIYDMMVNAGTDNKVSEKEFTAYSKKHYTKLLNWIKDYLDSAKDEGIKSNLITKSSNGLIATDRFNELGTRTYGLRRFFKEFNSLSDKTPIEVHLWNYYLIYSQLFGMAKEVIEEFKSMYPEMISDDDYGNYYYISNFSTSSCNAASSARSHAESYSSGGGGFSSGGGGGGSFGGGGSGGGGFR